MNYEKYLGKEMNEVVDQNAKKALDDYKKKSAEVDKTIQAIQKKLKIHFKRFVSGKGPDLSYVGDLERILQDLKNIDDYIRY
jgi:hypothetical protein